MAINPWREVLRALQAELDRLSQEIEGRSVVPNGVLAVLPATRFEKWSPILEAVTAELGEALVAWVAGSRRVWYGGSGPFLTLRLDDERVQPEITCEFLASPPGEPVSTREESEAVRGASAAEVESAAEQETAWPVEPVLSVDAPAVERLDIDAGLSCPLAGVPAAETETGGDEVGKSEEGELHLSRIELD